MKNTNILFGIISITALLLMNSCNTKSSKTKKSSEDKGSSEVTEISEDALLDSIQKGTFRYFWDGAEPNSGMAPERIHMDGDYPLDDKDIVTTGGSGFGLMTILAGIKRGFVSREEAFERFKKIVDFLEGADRFHGAWPHWIEGKTGKVKAFSDQDDGGDLVETAFLIQGLLTVREYFKDGDNEEQELAQKIDTLWQEVEWDWYTQNDNVLYWHWSPEHDWGMNHKIEGYDESLITYILAASSPTHAISPEVYHEGWARSGKIKDTFNYEDYTLQLKHNGINGGPLFWAHYSYLGLSPKGLSDRYADYWQENKNQTLINYAWCVKNRLGYEGYGENNWGLSASYSVDGYAAHFPGEDGDLGVISPTAAISSIPYTPKESIKAMHHWFDTKKERLWGPYGFYDAFSDTEKWYPDKYLAIDQGPQTVMIENYRSGMLWDLFMSAPEVKEGLKKLDFESPYLD